MNRPNTITRPIEWTSFIAGEAIEFVPNDEVSERELEILFKLDNYDAYSGHLLRQGYTKLHEKVKEAATRVLLDDLNKAKRRRPTGNKLRFIRDLESNPAYKPLLPDAHCWVPY